MYSFIRYAEAAQFGTHIEAIEVTEILKKCYEDKNLTKLSHKIIS